MIIISTSKEHIEASLLFQANAMEFFYLKFAPYTLALAYSMWWNANVDRTPHIWAEFLHGIINSFSEVVMQKEPADAYLS